MGEQRVVVVVEAERREAAALQHAFADWRVPSPRPGCNPDPPPPPPPQHRSLVHCAPLVSQVGGGPAAGRGKDRMLTLHTEPLPAPLGDEEFAASLAETNGLLSSAPPPPNLQRDERLAAQLAAELVEVDNMAPEVRLTRIRTSLVHATTPCCAQR